MGEFLILSDFYKKRVVFPVAWEEGKLFLFLPHMPLPSLIAILLSQGTLEPIKAIWGLINPLVPDDPL